MIADVRPMRPGSSQVRAAAFVWWGLVVCWFSTFAHAGALQRDDVVRFFPAPYIVGERDAALPVWPIFKQNATSDELVAYVFESVDFSPIPGFSGSPIDLLVALAPDGGFLDVKVISQHEPVFVDGLGPEPLFDFVTQYRGASLKQTIKVGPPGGGAHADASMAIIDGVAKATASVRIINESLITASLVVARKKLGFAEGRDPSRAARVRTDVFERLDFSQLLARGYIQRYTVSNAQSEAAFADSDVAGDDREVRAHPDAPFVDLYVGLLDSPMVGRNLLDERVYNRLISDLDGRRALLVISAGRLSFMDDAFVAGAVPTRLTMSQSGAPVEMRDFAWRKPFAAALPDGDLSVLVIKPQSGWDPASTGQFAIRATRAKGQILPELVSRDFGFAFSVPHDLLILPAPETPKGALGVWRDRWFDVATISIALALLTFALANPRRWAQAPGRLVWLRRAFLLFTLVFIGWRAQAQLSVVTLIGLMRAARGEGAWTFLFYDPPSLLLWAFTLATLVVWGRGTFCGWLCPFGALQEFAGDLGRSLGAKPLRIPPSLDRALRGLKYVVLVAILATAAFYSAGAETAAEAEPFKTAITLVFARSAPFIAYAVLWLIASAFVFKAFCRYVCPLGAAFAILGLLRRWDWIARRAECGSPCQLCRVKCRYDAIAPSGRVAYHECFQCLDCVGIHADAGRCVPLKLEARRGRRLEIRGAVK